MTIDHPIFQQHPEHDHAFTAWFELHGWPVTMRHFDDGLDVFAWRHEGQGIDRTLRVTQTVVEDYPPARIIALLEFARAAKLLVRHAGKYVVLRRQSAGGIGLEVLDNRPS